MPSLDQGILFHAMPPYFLLCAVQILDLCAGHVSEVSKCQGCLSKATAKAPPRRVTHRRAVCRTQPGATPPFWDRMRPAPRRQQSGPRGSRTADWGAPPQAAMAMQLGVHSCGIAWAAARCQRPPQQPLAVASCRVWARDGGARYWGGCAHPRTRRGPHFLASLFDAVGERAAPRGGIPGGACSGGKAPRGGGRHQIGGVRRHLPPAPAADSPIW